LKRVRATHSCCYAAEKLPGRAICFRKSFERPIPRRAIVNEADREWLKVAKVNL